MTMFEDIPIHKMTIENAFDGLGFYGPIILFIFVIWSLWKVPKYLVVYVFGFFINNWLNRFLKMMFLQERPDKHIPFSKYEKYDGEHHYGMPSGHAQSMAFSSLFLFLVKGFSFLWYFSVFMALLTFYQRWKYRRHTVEQIGAGMLTGGLWAWILYVLSNNYFIEMTTMN